MATAGSNAPPARLHGLLDDREEGVERLAFVATVLFAAATFWLAPHLPMIDLPQHAGQVAAWHDLVLGTSKWEPLLYINFFTPYLVGYGLALLLSFVVPVTAALKLVLALAYCGFVAACVALRRRLGGEPRLDWLFIPGFLGYAYAWGFYTFLVATPFGVLFILLAHRYADRPTAVLGVVLFAADVVLFFAHGLVFLFANAIGVAFLLLRCRRVLPLARAALPYVAAGLWCVCYVLIRLRFETSSIGEPSHIAWGWDLGRLHFLLFSMSWPLGGFAGDPIFAPLLALMVAAPLVLRARPNRHDATAFVPFAATLVVWAVVPDAAMNTWFLYQRFAVFLLPFYAVMFGATEPASRGVVRLLWLPLACWVLLAVHAERVVAFARESAAFDTVLAATEPGHRALSLIFDGASAAAHNPLAYWNFPLWYQAEKGGFVDFNAAGSLPPVVRYRPGRAPTAFVTPTWAWQPAGEFEWKKNQAEIYRYFFVRRGTPLPPGYFPTDRCAPVLLKSADDWSVFENVNCHQALPSAR